MLSSLRSGEVLDVSSRAGFTTYVKLVFSTGHFDDWELVRVILRPDPFLFPALSPGPSRDGTARSAAAGCVPAAAG
jgi:hypothetical protein